MITFFLPGDGIIFRQMAKNLSRAYNRVPHLPQARPVMETAADKFVSSAPKAQQTGRSLAGILFSIS